MRISANNDISEREKKIMQKLLILIYELCENFDIDISN